MLPSVCFTISAGGILLIKSNAASSGSAYLPFLFSMYYRYNISTLPFCCFSIRQSRLVRKWKFAQKTTKAQNGEIETEKKNETEKMEIEKNDSGMRKNSCDDEFGG